MLHSTTILAVRHRDRSVMAGDGQVTVGQTVVKQSARKIRRLYGDKILAGFAGSAADSFALFSRFESKLEQYRGNLERSAVDFYRAELDHDELHIPEALAGYRRALEMLATLTDRATEPGSRPRLLESQARTQSRIGRLLALTSRFAEATEAYRRAREILEPLIESDPHHEVGPILM